MFTRLSIGISAFSL